MSGRPFVTVQNGKLQGVQRVSEFSSQIYYSFLGIPYAKPPIGELRFKAPETAENWGGIRSASEGNECAQFSVYHHNQFIGSEDCLYVNVHVPEVPRKIKTLKAVMVLIHSGGHLWGAGTTRMHGSPDYLIHHDIVYVTLNYRLHILGFLNLRLPECPGNAGIKDVVMALQWIQKNIENFGGDPDNVTLCGPCTGGSLIHILMLTSAAKGLYHKVIATGDYAFNPLTNYQEDTVELAFEYGKLLGFAGNSVEKLFQFFKNLPTLKLCSKMNEMTTIVAQKYGRILPTAPFLPSVEHIVEGSVLSTSPVELMHSIDPVPMIYGVCENEAIFGFMDKMKLTPGKKYKQIFKENCWHWMHSLDTRTLNEVIAKVKRYYFGDEKLFNIPAAINIYNDASIADFYDTVADVVTKKSPSTPVYVYSFTYLGKLNNMRNLMGMCVSEKIKGTVHADDYFYMVKATPKFFGPVDENDAEVIQNYTGFLTTFAKTGKPATPSINIEWKETTPEKPYHLVFGEKIELREGKINGKGLQFWKDIKKYYQNV